MTEVVEKKFFRKPGEPLKVQICRLDDPEVAVLMHFAQKLGYIPYEQNGWICVDVLGGGLVWRAPDAVFKHMPSGTYVFQNGEIHSFEKNHARSD